MLCGSKDVDTLDQNVKPPSQGAEARGETDRADLPEKDGDMLTTIELSKIKNMKIAVVGCPGVGKSSICDRYFTDSFDSQHHKSNTVQPYTAVGQVSNHPIVSFSETFHEIPCGSSPLENKKHFAGIDGAIVVVELRDLVDIQLHAAEWRKKLLNGLGKGKPIVPMLLLGNKFDLVGGLYKPSESEKKEACIKKTSAFIASFTEDNDFTDSACVSAKDDETSLSLIRTFLNQKVRRHQMEKLFLDREATAAAAAAGCN